MSALTLYPYQTAMLTAVAEQRAAGRNRLLVKSATGTGKTVSFATMLTFGPIASWLEMFPANERKMLVIAHREELLAQAMDKIQRQNPTLRLGIEQADQYASRHCDVVIASIQTLAARKCARAKRVASHHVFRLVIVDEAHHAAAPSYRNVLAILGFIPTAEMSDEENAEAAEFDDAEKMAEALAAWDETAAQDRLLVGFTATPNRSDNVGLSCVFQRIAFDYGIKKAIDDGYLVPIRPWVIETRTSLEDVRTTHGDFNQRDLANAVNNPERNAQAIAGWREHAEGLSTLAFTVDVAHAHDVAEAFRKAGVTAEAVSGETPTEERRSLLQAYTDGRITVITNCMVLTEGTDLPRTGCILHMKPTKSATLYTQMTGRGLRLFPGKTECRVIDVVDIARRHSLQAAPVLYGLPTTMLTKGETLDRIEQAVMELREKMPQYGFEDRKTLAELNAVASTFDIWKIPDMAEHGEGLALPWLRMGEAFRLSYPHPPNSNGKEYVTVEPDMLGKFRVELVFQQQHAAGQWETSAPNVLVDGVASANEALQLAEGFVRQSRREAWQLKNKLAGWKRAGATEKQLGFLRRMGVPHAPGISAGDASQLIDLAILRKGRR